MQHFTTTGALIKNHSRIGWHMLQFGEPALRTGNDSIQFNFHLYNSFDQHASNPSYTASNSTREVL